jgi:hypothetical protein
MLIGLHDAELDHMPYRYVYSKSYINHTWQSFKYNVLEVENE